MLSGVGFLETFKQETSLLQGIYLHNALERKSDPDPQSGRKYLIYFPVFEIVLPWKIILFFPKKETKRKAETVNQKGYHPHNEWLLRFLRQTESFVWSAGYHHTTGFYHLSCLLIFAWIPWINLWTSCINNPVLKIRCFSLNQLHY